MFPIVQVIWSCFVCVCQQHLLVCEDRRGAEGRSEGRRVWQESSTSSEPDYTVTERTNPHLSRPEHTHAAQQHTLRQLVPRESMCVCVNKHLRRSQLNMILKTHPAVMKQINFLISRVAQLMDWEDVKQSASFSLKVLREQNYRNANQHGQFVCLKSRDNARNDL